MSMVREAIFRGPQRAGPIGTWGASDRLSVSPLSARPATSASGDRGRSVELLLGSRRDVDSPAGRVSQGPDRGRICPWPRRSCIPADAWIDPWQQGGASLLLTRWRWRGNTALALQTPARGRHGTDCFQLALPQAV